VWPAHKEPRGPRARRGLRARKVHRAISDHRGPRVRPAVLALKDPLDRLAALGQPGRLGNGVVSGLTARALPRNPCLDRSRATIILITLPAMFGA
jgi:hypothetical protein